MHSRKPQQNNRHTDTNGRVQFAKPTHTSLNLISFYVDRSEDIFGFIKRGLALGGVLYLLQGWRLLAGALSLFRKGPLIPAAKIVTGFLEKLIGNLSALSVIISGIQGILLLYKTLHVLAFSKDDKYTRGVQFLAGASALGLIVLSIVIFSGAVSVASPILFIAGAARGIGEHAMIGVIAIFNRFFSARSQIVSNRITELEKKFTLTNKGTKDDLTELTRLLKEEREGNEKIIGRTQGVIMSVGMLAGSILLMTPAAPAGIIVLASLTAFAIVDAVLSVATKQNSLRWAARGLNALAGMFLGKSPFNLEVKNEKNVLADLQNKTQKIITVHDNPIIPFAIHHATITPSSNAITCGMNDKGKEKDTENDDIIYSASNINNKLIAARNTPPLDTKIKFIGPIRHQPPSHFSFGSVFAKMQKTVCTLKRQPPSSAPTLFTPRIPRLLLIKENKAAHKKEGAIAKHRGYSL